MKRKLLTLTVAGLVAFGGFAVVQAQGRSGGGRGHALEHLTEGLNLTSDQKAKVQPLLDQAQPQIAAIRREAMQKIKSVVDSTASQIRPLLTPEQQKKLDDNQNTHRGRMKARDEADDTTGD
ncbi:MAG TPA: periplasmic heavy metal sensor [Candidatus Udaeobacter sp.]|jgi:Spy/CpxP family protein refolding chaperone|nr:periplasmic heavy metal sensor [Candidatus Udaeobacter sp.]